MDNLCNNCIHDDPVKIAMLIILLVLEIPAAIALAAWWKKACKDAKETEEGRRWQMKSG